MQSLAAELRIALQLIGNRPYLLDNLPLGKSRGPPHHSIGYTAALLLYSRISRMNRILEFAFRLL
jgi:hypothetical protein